MRTGLAGALCLALLLGASPWLAGLVVLARGNAAARSAVVLVEQRDLEPPAKVSRGPHLPKGCVLKLKASKPERWAVVVEHGAFGPRDLRPVKRLKTGTAAWVLKGQGPALDIHWPALAVARKELRLEATGYDPGPVDNSRGWVGTTRSGERARFGIVAVDPKLIPLGTWVYVEGYGPGLAADVGGAIKGARIDLCFNSSAQARAWGRKKARVWVVDPAPKADRAGLRALAGTGL